MDDNKLLDSFLLPLADLYEGGISNRWSPIEPSSVEEYEPLRELLAQLRADGLLTAGPGKNGPYRLTPKGYARFKDRITALRKLGGRT